MLAVGFWVRDAGYKIPPAMRIVYPFGFLSAKKKPVHIGLSQSMAAPISLSPHFGGIHIPGKNALLQFKRMSLENNRISPVDGQAGSMLFGRLTPKNADSQKRRRAPATHHPSRCRLSSSHSTSGSPARAASCDEHDPQAVV